METIFIGFYLFPSKVGRIKANFSPFDKKSIFSKRSIFKNFLLTFSEL
jgi:hypothetical protein